MRVVTAEDGHLCFRNLIAARLFFSLNLKTSFGTYLTLASGDYVDRTSYHRFVCRYRCGPCFAVWACNTLTKVFQALSNCLSSDNESSCAERCRFILLMLFVFAVLGMQLFGVVRKGPWLAELADFKTFPQALLTLFQVVAGG